MSTNLYRTKITIEVLSEGPFTTEDLAEINYAITEGDCSGVVNVETSEELSREEMSKALEKQGSDPEFLTSEQERQAERDGIIDRMKETGEL